MYYYPGTGYAHCRSGSDSGLTHRRTSIRRDLTEAIDDDSGDSTLSELEGKKVSPTEI